MQKQQRELGRLRLGSRGPKGNPTRLKTWRFTSADQNLLVHVADEYGGKVQPWETPRGDNKFQIITETDTIPVMIPASNDMDAQQNMELWAKGGLVRRCDGVTAQVATEQDDAWMIQPCVCDEEDDLKCGPSTLVKLWLPDIAGIGVWILTSTGWNAAKELAADVDMLAGKEVVVELGIDWRESKRKGQGVKKFPVPIIKTSVTLRSLLEAGAMAPSRSLSVPEPSPPSLPPSSSDLSSETVGEVSNADDDEDDGGFLGLADAATEIEPLPRRSPDEIAEAATEQAWVDLYAELESPSHGTMDENEVAVRSLFRRMYQVGLWKEHALSASLASRGFEHLRGKMRAAELQDFCDKAWEAARRDILEAQ